jgi:HEAT repeat protein
VGGKEAAEALGAMGSSVASLLPRLTDLRPRLKNYGEQKKDDNILALGDEVQAAIDKIKGVHDGKTCAQWIAQLRGPDNDARRKAQAALRVIGLTAVSPLAKLAVADPDAAVRLAAIQALRTGSAGTLAVTDLLKCLKDSELPVRQAAAHALTETAVRVIQGDRIWEVQRYANPIVSGLEQAAKVAQGQEAENLRACLKKIQN